MDKNIVIFSDGTGQRGGLLFEERRSNIYKLYRATRCGPDSSINPSEQLAYYDPGIGTVPGGLGLVGAIARKIYNLVSQATGLGLTANIVDCYAAILRLWQPGDRIFLFGFSRGAYTVRCVSGVLALCGVPTQMKDGSPLKRDQSSVRKIAKEAVKKVHQHVSSPRDAKYVPQRQALAERFRKAYASDARGDSNANPHLIGVFDTVASIASLGSLMIVVGLAFLSVALASAVLWLFLSSFWFWFRCLTATMVFGAFIAYLVTHTKVAFGLEAYRWWETLHFTDARIKFFDTQLDPNVGSKASSMEIRSTRGVKSLSTLMAASPSRW